MTSIPHVSRNQPITDPRLLRIANAFKAADERKKELMYRQAMALPCQKGAA